MKCATLDRVWYSYFNNRAGDKHQREEETMARTRKDNEIRRKIKHLKAVRGLERRAHFEAGGTLEGWLGRHLVETNDLHEGRRLACRSWKDDEV